MKQMKKLEKGTYIIGVCGGPDSMALLDMCRKEGFQLFHNGGIVVSCDGERTG